MFFEKTVTLYNFHKKSGRWYTTVFPQSYFLDTRAASSSQHGTTSGDSANFFFHTSADKSASTTEGIKQYAYPKAYAQLDSPAGYYTFTPQYDFFIHGSYPLTENVSEDDYDNGLFHELNKEMDEVYMISSASFFDLIPHFEVRGG